MKNILLALPLLSILSTAAFAQQEKKKPAFHSVEQVAMVNGNNAVSGAIQTVNGFGYNNWFAGIGIGLDFYRYRSVPLFVDVKRFFPIRNANSIFVYADGGYNLPWTKQAEVPESVWTIWSWPSKTESKYKGGAYMDAGIGYNVNFKKGNALLMSAGYSYKYFSETRTTTSWPGGVAGSGNETIDVQTFTYSFNRLMIKIGWQF